LLDHRLRGGPAENHLIHGAENDPSLMHVLVLPWHFGFVGSLEGTLAEEIQDVMPEDEVAGLPVPPPGLVLYGRHASPFVRRVAVTLRLYGVVYRHVPLMPFGPDKAELAKFNPIARVPALRLNNGEMLIDSAVILDHLDQVAGPLASLTPAAGAARRRVLTLLAVALGANEKLVAGLYERHFRSREAWHTPWLNTCDKQVRDGFAWLDAEFAGPWFAGSAMTQADITVAVFWLFGRAKRPRFFDRLDCKRLEVLAERLQETPAFQATMPEPETLADQLT
jgi:glutathione S-transferase